ncbi:MAG TPA: hypothetical protein VMF55_04415 [Solirubrobacterales bacterium]|nr:hypothetical protein [Solirubrobacterales bacterium]
MNSRIRATAFAAALAALLVAAPAANADWTAVPPAFTGNDNAALSYGDQGTLTELDTDPGLPGGVYHARSRPAGGVFGSDFELPFLLPLSATRPDGTEVLVGMDASHDVHTALRADAATTFAVTDEHSTSQTYPPAGVSVSSSGAGLAEWVDAAGHLQIAELPSSGSSFGGPAAALPGNPAQSVTFLSVVHPVLDPSGAAVLTWATSTESGGKVYYQLQQSTRASAAGAFGAASAVGPDIEVEPQVVANRAGVAAAVWWNKAAGHLEVSLRQPGGSFGAATTIATPAGSFDASALQAGVMGDGTVVVLWRDYAGPHTCADGGNAATLHLDTLAPGGSWQAAAAGSTENEVAIGSRSPVLAVSQSTFTVADVLAEGQGAAPCGTGTQRVYAWQGAPGAFDGHAWTLLPGQPAASAPEYLAIAADPQGDATVTWRVGKDRYEATTGGAGNGGGGDGDGTGGSGGGADGGGGPQSFGSPPLQHGPSTPGKTPTADAVSVPTVTVVAFNIGLGRPETVEMPITCVSSAPCSIMATAAINLYWGVLGRQAFARPNGKAKSRSVSLTLPQVRLQLAAHAKGKLAIKVPKATMKRLEALLHTKGAKATLTVKLRVGGVPQSHTISTALRFRKAKPQR